VGKPRDALWEGSDRRWDVIIVGGGITGAGILHEAASGGLDALLIEQGDFASGTSSRSGKLIHGGIRYLRNRQFRISFDSVREREHLIQEIPGLVSRQPMHFVCFRQDPYRSRQLARDLALYELFARRIGVKRDSRYWVSAELPWLDGNAMETTYEYSEAVTDDSRLVLRILAEARNLGGAATN
jgi:glycerol-3-phosphate dehydrogenase